MKKKITIDAILSAISVAALAFAIYELLNTKSIPFKWRMAAIAVASILVLLLVLLGLKKFPKWATWLRRGCISLLAIGLIVSGFYVGKVSRFTKNITAVKDATENVEIVVKADSEIEKVQDLEGLKVGIQTGNDKEAGQYVQEQLDRDVEVEYVENEDYVQLASDLMKNDIDALIITEGYIKSVSEFDSDFDDNIKSIKSYTRTLENSVLNGNDAIDLNKDCFTVLISGIDTSGTPNQNSRSDVIMLAMVNPNTKVIQLASFPRDAYLPNPALGYQNDKLTHTGNSGVEVTIEALENVIGFDIDFYVKVNFSSVVAIVDALGGVTIDVPYAFCEQDSARNFSNKQCLEVGEQEVNGEQALAFARHRKSNGVGDIGRTKAQQEVLRGMIEKATSAEGMTKIPEILDMLPEYCVTNISENQMESFISYQLDHMGSWTIKKYSLENNQGAMLTTASMGSTLLSCQLISAADVEELYRLHYLVYNDMKFSDFSFDLNNLEYPTPGFTLNNDITYAGGDTSKYDGSSSESNVITEKPSEQLSSPTTVEEQATEAPTETKQPAKEEKTETKQPTKEETKKEETVEPTTPEETVEPTEPTQPTEPTEPTEPTTPEEPTETSE